ncbi:hypothetical protein AVEN_152980-1 [Araneus ventricosus]|uniref:Uncharacterized protein n=1 Tax=Araneus ventricosus TaxID=182803 RepID=A0A4Y2ADJ4_ARAVE|nr:hypothetical protein AVEN_152980-1 [Araneus ventricosus]
MQTRILLCSNPSADPTHGSECYSKHQAGISEIASYEHSQKSFEENVQTKEIRLTSLINQLQNTNPMSNTEALQWAAEADDSLARNEIIRKVTAEDDDDGTPVNPVKINHSEAVAALNTSLQRAE